MKNPIPQHVLNQEIYEDWDLGGVTLEQEIKEKFKNEPVIDAQYTLDTNGAIRSLVAYSPSYVGTLVFGAFSGLSLIVLRRDP